jgi:hypothetical protein
MFYISMKYDLHVSGKSILNRFGVFPIYALLLLYFMSPWSVVDFFSIALSALKITVLLPISV